MRYEMIREIFNQCSNNQMRDVSVEDVTTDDTDAVIHSYCVGKEFSLEKDVTPEGVIVYNLYISGLHQRFSFTPEDDDCSIYGNMSMRPIPRVLRPSVA